MHATRLDPSLYPNLSKVETAFWEQVDKGGTCWLWTGAKNRAGYGRFFFTPETKVHTSQLAHRFAKALTSGPIPAGLFACHVCDNPPCVNPDHIFLGTSRDNISDRMRKGRPGSTYARDGALNPHAKLTAETVLAIRQSELKPRRAVAEAFGVSEITVDRIRHGRSWVKGPWPADQAHAL